MAHLEQVWSYIGVKSAPSIILDVSAAELLSDIWEGIHRISDLSLDQSYTLNKYWSHLRGCIRYKFQQPIPGFTNRAFVHSLHME